MPRVRPVCILTVRGAAPVSFCVRRTMKTFKNSQGGCICGSARYKIIAEPITLFACHCSDCQTVTGSGFVLALRVPYNGITVLQGEIKPYERKEADERRR